MTASTSTVAPLVVGGYSIPETDVDGTATAIMAIVKGKMAGQSAEQIFATVEPTAMSTIEGIANVFFPGAGTGLAIVALLLKYLIWLEQNAKPQTQEQVNAWMDRFGAGNA